MSSHAPTFSAIDASYSLPDNVALITLQVDGFFMDRKRETHNYPLFRYTCIILSLRQRSILQKSIVVW